MKKIVILLLDLVMMVCLASCGVVEGFHYCESACPECGKCQDLDCVVSICAEKCEGNHPVHQHSLTKVEEKASTCSEAGYEAYYTCECGKIFSDEAGENKIDAPIAKELLSHTEETVEGKDATCTETGLTEGKICSDCKKVLVAQEEISEKGHSFTNYISVGDATCEADGTKTAKCDRCDATDTKADENSKKGHDYSSAWVSDANGHWHICANGCGVNGSQAAHTPNIENATEYDAKVCTVCNYVIEQALGHTSHTYNVAQYDESHHWNKCYGCDLIDEKIAHSYSESIVNDATCTESGTKKLTCSCGFNKNETIAAKGHTDETVAGKDATCTETGLKDGKKCSVCGVTTLAQETIPAKGHTNAAAVVENNVAPTCTEAGSYDNVIKCSVCTAEVSRETVTVKALGHTDETVAGKDSTCTETGLTDGKKCSVCGVTTLAQETIPAKGHTNAAAVVENNVAPTCTEAGSYDNVIKCSVCTAEVSRETVSVDALGHNYVEGICSRCGKTEPTVSVNIKDYASANSWEDMKRYYTVKVDNVITLKASENGNNNAKFVEGTDWKFYRSDNPTLTVSAAKGYVIVSVTLTYNIYNSGVLVFNGTNIASGTELTINSASAVFSVGNTNTATNGQIGFINIDVVYAKFECTHENTTTTTENATCTVAGSSIVTCDYCGEIVSTAEIPALGHTEVTVAGKSATCTETGLKDGKKCSVCGVTTLAQETTPAKGHNFVKGVCSTCGAEDPDYVKIVFSVPNGVNSVEMEEGNILPTAGAPADYTFAGWSESTFEETTTKPAILLAGSAYTGNATVLYAVYTRTETTAGSSVFEKVTSAPSDWSGNYLIVYEAGKVAFNGALTTLDAVSNTVSVTISNSKISVTNTLKGAMFTIAKSGSSYTVKSASGYYIGQTADSNELKSNKTTTYANTISINSDGTVNIVGAKNGHLRYNSTSGQTRFRYFKEATYSQQKAICLYKLVETAGSTITYYSTIKDECNHSYSYVVTAPNCLEGGYTTYTCSGCGDSYVDNQVAALGHNFVNGKCSRCDATTSEETKVSVNIQEYASSNGWTNDKQYNTVKMDDVITLTASKGSQHNGKYLTNGYLWKIYRSESGTLTVSAAEGYKIVSVKFTYNASNSGILVYNGTNVASGTELTIDSASAVFSVGNTNNKTNGQVGFTNIEVVYAKIDE